jgi:KaiC/GvpD/RAD55 family RecA-like ATPase
VEENQDYSMNKQGNKGHKPKKHFKVPAHTRRVLDYWYTSLIKSAEIEGLMDPRSDAWLSISRDVLTGEMLPVELFDVLNKNSRESDQGHGSSNQTGAIEVVISPLRFHEESKRKKSVNYDFLLIPALISDTGKLLPPDKALPWIPREFLEPVCGDRFPTISTVDRTEKFFHRYKNNTFRSFSEYLHYCNQFMKYASGESVDSLSMEGYERASSSFIRSYSVNLSAIRGVLKIIDEVIQGKRNPGLLAEMTRQKKQKRKLYRSSKYSAYSLSTRHLGHFSSEYALAPSQRLAVHRFLETPEGEVYCVNGPPGTGKTTVLQSFIASLWVKSALSEDTFPPVCLVCGATNQSVLNVINSFEADSKIPSVLEKRWIPEVHSYGSFISSFTKSEAVEEYQIELANGRGFSSSMEDREFIASAKNGFLGAYAALYGPAKSVKSAVKELHALLQKEVKELSRAMIASTEMSFFDILKSPFSRISKEEMRKILSQVEKFDTTFRYKAFMLATHYWEGRWILETEKELLQRDRNNDTGIRFRSGSSDWGRRAMITPVFVSTISMGARFFSTKEHRSSPPLDVLFFDEAGQVSSELGAPLSALAKKMVVIGDTLQLSPYASIPSHIDEALLQDASLISGKREAEFHAIVKSGISASSSNLMQLAISLCKREDGTTIGASLEEHRRSVPEIVSFCNALSYHGRLIPVRKEMEKRMLPCFGFYEVHGRSQRVGQSRKNVKEADLLANYIASLERRICDFYRVSYLDEVLAVITPFTAQASELEKRLRGRYRSMVIGTVHSLQGAEKPVIIFSSVYDETHSGNYVFNIDKRILNVAVSRAKDSFLVFGSRRTFEDDSRGPLPSFMLGKYLFSSDRNRLDS